MTTQEPDGRFVYAHGLVWDSARDCGVPRARNATVAGERVAAIAAWTPKPRILHVYCQPDGSHVWQWEPHPPGGPYVR